MSRILKNMGLLLGFLIIILVVLNIFVVMPLLREKPVQLSTIPEELPERLEFDDDLVIIDTLAEIRDVNGDESYIHVDPGDENIRNPFFWPEERKEVVEIVETGEPVGTEESEPQKPQLSMVIVGKQRRQALIDEVFVSEGDKFYGYQVKRITENEVVLSDGLGDLSIFLTTAGEESGQYLSPGGLIER